MLFFDEGHIKYPEYYLLTTEEGETISSVITTFWATQPRPDELTDEDLLAQQHEAAFIKALKDKNIGIDRIRDLCVKICSSDIWTIIPPEEFIVGTGEAAPYECVIETLDARLRGKKFVPGLNGAPDLQDIPSLYAFLNIPEGRKYVPYAEYFIAQDLILIFPKPKAQYITEDVIEPLNLQLFSGEVEGKKPIRRRRSKADRIAPYIGETIIGQYPGNDIFLFLSNAMKSEGILGETKVDIYSAEYANGKTKQIISPKDAFTSIGGRVYISVTLDKMIQQINHAIRNGLTERRESGNYLTISLSEFMAFRGLKDRKSAQVQFSNAVQTLCEITLKETETSTDGRKKPVGITRFASLDCSTEEERKEFKYRLALDPIFYEYVSQARTAFLPEALMKVRHENAYLIGRRILSHTAQNYKPGEMTAISVKTLLNVCAFKRPEDLTHKGKTRPSDAGQKIIQPFEACMEHLVDKGVIASFEYHKAGGAVLTDNELNAMRNNYSLFSSLVLYCTIPKKQAEKYDGITNRRLSKATTTTRKSNGKKHTGGKGT